MARLRFGDQSIPKVTRVAAGGGGGSLGGLSDVDLTDTSQGGLANGSMPVSYTHLTLPTNREV